MPTLHRRIAAALLIAPTIVLTLHCVCAARRKAGDPTCHLLRCNDDLAGPASQSLPADIWDPVRHTRLGNGPYGLGVVGNRQRNLTRALQENVPGITLENAAGNPFQPDGFYHGFRASALQGVAQGLAVYVNGVRFNQPFGDTVNWDLIRSNAIDQVN